MNAAVASTSNKISHSSPSTSGMLCYGRGTTQRGVRPQNIVSGPAQWFAVCATDQAPSRNIVRSKRTGGGGRGSTRRNEFRCQMIRSASPFDRPTFTVGSCPPFC
ncbi:hypothetical protein CEXT_664491 [Caerostris extrusa]|uniref:Uncharacterized protein n=1 Tax=Caerostris extrusa TaxID=172846 RepID=A0AAV4WQC6_CAEEX|nr:hypothetical protein CEXT_664491 [Caerostris extrusa]